MTFESELARSADASEAARVFVCWVGRVDRDAAIRATVDHLTKLGLTEDIAERELLAELSIAAVSIARRRRRR